MAVRCPSCARLVPEGTGYCSHCGSSLVAPLRLSWLVRLFWSCPTCGSAAPLTVNQPFFGGPTLGCAACGTHWRLDPEARTLAQLDRGTRQPVETKPLEDWLARLAPPLSWRPLPAPHLLLLPGETCLVRVERATMLAPRQSVLSRHPAGRVEIAPGIYERIAADPLGPSPRMLATVARGPLSVTDRRVVFMGDRKHVEAPLPRLAAVEVDEDFLLLHRPARTDTFGLADESAVKIRAAILAVRARLLRERAEADAGAANGRPGGVAGEVDAETSGLAPTAGDAPEQPN